MAEKTKAETRRKKPKDQEPKAEGQRPPAPAKVLPPAYHFEDWASI